MNTRFHQSLFALVMTVCVSSAPGQAGTGDGADSAPTSKEGISITNADSGSTAVALDEEAMKQEQLKKLLAPIALYPDVLLAQVLPACTYPLEVVQAARWVKDNPEDAKKPEAIEKLQFDPSVKAVMQFPDTLALMDKHIDATSKLGEYFLADSDSVFSVIQDLRKVAKDAGSLKDSPQQQITENNNSIVIQSPDPQVIYVPQYNPNTVYVPQAQSTVVYGTGGYSYYSEPSDVYVQGYSGYNAAAGLVAFGTGVAVGAWGANNIDWDDGDIDIDVDWDGDRPNWWGGNDVDIDVGDININKNEFNNQLNKLDASQRTEIQNNFNKLSKTDQNQMLKGFNNLPADQRAGAMNDLANLKKGSVNAGAKTKWQHDATRPGALPSTGVTSRPGAPSAATRPSTLPAGGAKRPTIGSSTARMSSADIQNRLNASPSSRPAGASSNEVSAANRGSSSMSRPTSSARPSNVGSANERPSSSASRASDMSSNRLSSSSASTRQSRSSSRSSLSDYGSGSLAKSASSRGSSSRSSSAISRPSSGSRSGSSSMSRPSSGGSRPSAGARSGGGGRSGGGRR